MNDFTFTKMGFHEYVEWQTENKKTLKGSTTCWKIFAATGFCKEKESRNA